MGQGREGREDHAELTMGSRFGEIALLHWLFPAVPLIAAVVVGHMVDRFVLKSPRPTWKETFEHRVFWWRKTDAEWTHVLILLGAMFVTITLTSILIFVLDRSLR